MQVFYPPSPLPNTKKSLFLAGSIAMGKAKPWQDEVAQAFAQTDWIILNPRRPDWDSSWKQDLTDKNFVGQVNWELDAQEASSHILMYFDPDTQAPISLLELGLFAQSGKMRVCCPDGFWRKGNVEIVCLKYGIPMFPSLETLVHAILTEG